MTNRLYYTDAMRASFDATVVSAESVEGRTHVVLDETLFYPTSGGQPFDTGELNGARVVEVIDRDDESIARGCEPSGPERDWLVHDLPVDPPPSTDELLREFARGGP